MTKTQLTEEEQAEWWLFLNANPIGVDPNIINPAQAVELPENIRKVLWDDKTSSLIYLTCDKHGLSDEQISDVARVVREIALGNINPSEFFLTIKSRLETTDAISQDISAQLTTKLIAPNYFQISQLYEKKHKSVPSTPKPVTPTPPKQPLSGRPLESLSAEKGKPVNSMNDWAGDDDDAANAKDTQIVPNRPSKNVVDLRKLETPPPTPPGLPPTPPVAPKSK